MCIYRYVFYEIGWNRRGDPYFLVELIIKRLPLERKKWEKEKKGEESRQFY